MTVVAIKYMLWAQDMQRGIAFYRNAFGFSVAFQSEHWSELTLAGSTVALHGGHDGSSNKTGLSLQVHDIEEACSRAHEAGAQILQPPQSRPGEPISLATIVDPEGNEIMLTQFLGD